MNSKEKIKKEIEVCIAQGTLIILHLQGKIKKEKGKEEFSFHTEYQKWYSMALKIVEHISPDRYAEYISYYEVDKKRKTLGYGTYVIQDYLKGVGPNRYSYPDFDIKEEVLKCIYNQYTILRAISERIDNVLSDIQGTLYVELQDLELETAKSLLKINIRSAGVIAGVILENYLKHVVENHKLKTTKKNPTLSDFNELLKSNQVYDISVWRKISYLSDIRNNCAHKNETEPTKEMVSELIEGVNWVNKNVF